jgi:hypothetical protein
MQGNKPFPGWAAPENMRWAWWGWEPLAERQRGGGKGVPYFGVTRWTQQWHDEMFSEATIRRMRALGINFAVTHFFKGFGLKSEHAEMMQTAEFVKKCHRHGIRVAGYTQFRSLYYETFLKEEPKALSWIQRKADGSLATWGGAYYRLSPCINSPEFIWYLKKVIKYGAREIGLDAFHFDNSYAGPCYCPRCKKLFRAYLGKNVREQSRMSFLDFSHVEFPPYNDTSADVRDPLYQEWIRFRVERLSETWRDLYRYVKTINPELGVITNPGFPRSPGWANRLSVHPYDFGRCTDFTFAENGNFPCMRGENPVTQIRAYKAAEAGGYRVIPTAWLGDKTGNTRCPETGREVTLSLAEAAAFGGIAGTTWALRTTAPHKMVIDNPGLAPALGKFISFLDRHQGIYAGAATDSSVAMLHSFESFAFRAETACQRFMGLEQALITANIPYDVLFTEALDKINRYSLVIVAGQACLSDAVLARLRDYVRRGGKLIVTPESGALDENTLQRERNGFDEIVNGTSAVRLHPPRKAEKIMDSVKWIYTQVVSVPEDGPALVGLVRKMLGDKLPFQISSPAGVIANWTKLPGGRRVLHLINYNNNSGKKINVSIRFAPGVFAGRTYSIYRPESAAKPPAGSFGKRPTIRIRALDTYAAVVVG